MIRRRTIYIKGGKNSDVRDNKYLKTLNYFLHAPTHIKDFFVFFTGFPPEGSPQVDVILNEVKQTLNKVKTTLLEDYGKPIRIIGGVESMRKIGLNINNINYEQMGFICLGTKPKPFDENLRGYDKLVGRQLWINAIRNCGYLAIEDTRRIGVGFHEHGRFKAGFNLVAATIRSDIQFDQNLVMNIGNHWKGLSGRLNGKGNEGFLIVNSSTASLVLHDFPVDVDLAKKELGAAFFSDSSMGKFESIENDPSMSYEKIGEGPIIISKYNGNGEVEIIQI